MSENEITKKLTCSQLMATPFSIAEVKVNFSQNSITRAGETYVLQPKVLELLVLLCYAQGETLSKQALADALWPDTVVGPDSLANTMARLRKALNDDAKNPKFIQTVQRKGYRLLQPVVLTVEQPSHFLTSKLVISSLVVFLCALTVFVLQTPSKETVSNQFLFPDLTIKKLEGGGYEIQAGIDGELTEEKKAAMLAEIKRITGEEHTDMVFTVDPIKSSCDKKHKNKAAVECIEQDAEQQ
ncbi:transcriptional regulator [Colwelliaceae bacterium BS250]